MCKNGTRLACLGVIVLAASAARGECPVLGFGDLPTNTAVTTQYDGVTFSVQELPAACGVSFGRIALPAQGTASPSKALCVDAGSMPNPPCEFHPQWLRMVFDSPIHKIEFAVGPGNAESFQDYTIRAYTTTSGGGGLVSTTAVTDAGNGVFRTVSLAFASDVRRMEIEGMNGVESMGIECIDELAFRFDDTGPTADITSPVGSPASRDVCVCHVVPVWGVVCDEDGAYERDELEYRRSGTAAWQLAGSATVPVCEESGLYNWSTEDPPLDEDFYDLRVTSWNACGMSSSDTTTVYVDKHFSLVPGNVRAPAHGAILGGTVCFDGWIWDQCFDHYTVERRSALGAFVPVDPAHAQYDTPVLNDPYAMWNTAGLADGTYETRTRGEDHCGNTADVLRSVVLDNTAPVALITAPVECGALEGVVPVRGTAFDANLENWTLSFVGGAVSSWSMIAGGDAPVVNGLLGNWDMSGAPACAYVLRLRVTDRAVLNCNSAERHVTDYYVGVNVGFCGDFDVDDDEDVDLDDFREFQDMFTGP